MIGVFGQTYWSIIKEHTGENPCVYQVQERLCSDVTLDSPAHNTLWREVNVANVGNPSVRAQYLLDIRSFIPWRIHVNSINVSSSQCELASGTTT